MRKRWYVAAVAALALLLASADTSSAGIFNRGGRGGGWGGGGYSGGYGNNNGLGYGGWNNGGWGYGGMNNGGWGYNGMNNGYGGNNAGYQPWAGAGYSPLYNTGYAPNNGFANSYASPGYVNSGLTTVPGDTTSFYYQPGMQAGFGGGVVANNAATVEVRVPADAQVWFDGDATSQRGADRLFSSPPLDTGKTYHYEVKARWTQNGRSVERTKRVDVRANQRATVDFNQNQDQAGE